MFVPLVSLIEKHSGYASDDSEIGAALTCRQRERKRTVEGFLKFKQRTDNELSIQSMPGRAHLFRMLFVARVNIFWPFIKNPGTWPGLLGRAR